MKDILRPILELLVVLPGLLLGYFPVKAYLKQSPGRLAVWLFPLMACLCIGSGLACYRLGASTFLALAGVALAAICLYTRMEQLLRQRAESIWTAAIRSVLPDEAVRRALEHFHPQGRVFLVAAGKAAWQMAHAALAVLGRVDAGIVITKYGHVRGPLPGVTCCEAGHPVPDDNSFAATQRALALVSGLRADDTVLFLLSGGGSALFEKPLLPAEELQAITQALLA